jgi:hypothetical protein
MADLNILSPAVSELEPRRLTSAEFQGLAALLMALSS